LEETSVPNEAVPLDQLERTWVDALEQGAMKTRLDKTWPDWRPGTYAEIGQMIAHAQQIEAWYGQFRATAEKLAAAGRPRLKDELKRYVDDIKGAEAIFRQMQQSAIVTNTNIDAIVNKSHADTMASLTAMHDARQAAYDAANAAWSKQFNS
jgi:hypothetical protein